MFSRMLLAAAVVFAAGCSADRYRERADTQVYELIARTQEEELGQAPAFSVDPPPEATQELEELKPLVPENELREALGGKRLEVDMPAGSEEDSGSVPGTGAVGDPPSGGTAPGDTPAPAAPLDPGEGGKTEAGPAGAGATPAEPDKFTLLEERGEAVPVPQEARVLGLADVLYLAFRHNRSFLSRKEGLYVDALALTLEQYRWTPRFRAALSGDVERSGDSSRMSLWDAGADVGMSLQLPDGGDLSASMSTDFSGDFGNRTTETAESTWAVNLVQPLLRGFGRSIAQEPLVQSERNVVYAVREFERFRRTFAVDIASQFFGVLRQVDTVRNQWDNYQSLKRNEERDVRLSEAGRKPAFEADQARQRTLAARDSWVRAVQSYELALDRFKITLGLPTELPLVLDARELAHLRKTETLEPPAVDLGEAIRIGLENRLDLMVDRDRVVDSQRQVRLSADQLRGDLSLSASASIASTPTGEALDARFHDGSYRLGVDYDLPVDRFSERNSYRRAQISLEQRRRAYSEAEDEVKLDVRDAYRGVQENIATYGIRQRSLELARERVKSVNLLIQAGRAKTRDLLEAQSDLVDAQNSVTQALVDLYIARLRLTQDLGLLRINDRGMWEPGTPTGEGTSEMSHE